MELLCGSSKFFSCTLNGLATALANLPTAPWDKVKQLFSFCPQLSSQPCVLGERELSAVTALGLFAVKTRLTQFGDHIVTYLLKLFESLPQARWADTTDSTARYHGPLAEHFTHRVTLILITLATLSNETRTKVASVLSIVLEKYTAVMTDVHKLEPAIVCDEVLPALIGLVWALRSTPQERTEKLRTVFTLSYEDSGQLQLSFKEFIRLRGHRLVNIPQEGDKGGKKNDFLGPFAQRVKFDEKCVMTLYHTATRILDAQVLQDLEDKVAQYNQSSALMACPYRGATYFLQYVYFSALQQLVVNSKLGTASIKEIHTQAEMHLRKCGRELGQAESHNYSGGCDQMYLLSRILGPLVIIYAWTSTSQLG